MFDLGKLTSDLLTSLDNVVKENLEDPGESATSIRSKKKISQSVLDDGEGVSTILFILT
jgi:hypothetical protein